MPRHYTMTPVPSQKRWLKQYEGKTYSVSFRQLDKLYGPGIPPTIDGSYQWANAWWSQKKLQIDMQAAARRRPAFPMEDIAAAMLGRDDSYPLDELPEHPDYPGERDYMRPEDAQRMIRHMVVQAVEEYLKSGRLPFNVEAVLPPARVNQIEEGVRLIEGRPQAAAPDQSVQAHADAWYKHLDARVAAGELSPDRRKHQEGRLKHLVAFLGPEADVAGITKQSWAGFYEHCLARIAERRKDTEAGWSPDFARYVFATAQTFVTWLAEREAIPPIPTLRSKAFRFRCPPKKVRTWTVDEFRAAVAAATERTRLYLLLGVNCGMLAKDISDLRPDEVDWENGRLRRRRSKTAHHANVPVVEYPLWPATFALLKKFRSADPTHVLLTEDKTVLVRPGRGDAVFAAYRRLRQTLPSFKGTPKQVRSFAASLLESSEEHARFSSLFLGHSPRGVKDQHYVDSRKGQALFDQAVLWLGRQVGQVE
jgi:integrase